MKVEVAAAGPDNAEVVGRLLELYLYEFTDIDGRDIGEDGRFGYRWLEEYWRGAGRYPFLIRVDGKLAGFALVMERCLLHPDASGHLIAEFFVLRKYRRKRVGTEAAEWLFSRFPGPWEVAEHGANVTAQAFWRQVIGRYADGAFQEREDAWEGQPAVVQIFDNAGRRHH